MIFIKERGRGKEFDLHICLIQNMKVKGRNMFNSKGNGGSLKLINFFIFVILS